MTKFLELFLQLPGIDVNRADNEGNTPLHFAAQAGKNEMVESHSLSKGTMNELFTLFKNTVFNVLIQMDQKNKNVHFTHAVIIEKNNLETIYILFII